MNNLKIGNFIADMRRNQKLTQKELAERLNVTDTAISKWERGLCYPDITIIENLCKILNITLIDFFKSEKINELKITNDKANEYILESISYSKGLIAADKKNHRKIIIRFALLVALSLMTLFFTIDYARYLNYKEPVFSLYTTSAVFGDSNITEYYGFGYKVIKYESKAGRNDMEFGSWFSKYKNINLDSYVVADLKSFILNVDAKKGDNQCFADVTILKTAETDDSLAVYTWIIEKCFYLKNDKIIKDESSSMPYKFILKANDDSLYKIIDYKFIEDGQDYKTSSTSCAIFKDS